MFNQLLHQSQTRSSQHLNKYDVKFCRLVKPNNHIFNTSFIENKSQTLNTESLLTSKIHNSCSKTNLHFSKRRLSTMGVPIKIDAMPYKSIDTLLITHIYKLLFF